MGLKIAGIEVSTGNPHFVIVVDNAEFAVAGQTVAADRRGDLRASRIFRIRPTWNFCASSVQHEIEIRIFERGVGPTTSSGTGTSATATAALALNGCHSPLTVVAPGGAQTVAWSGPGERVCLTGPASLIARGEAW